MKTLKEKIEHILRPIAESLGFEWIGCELKGGEQAQTLRIYVDHANGITIDDCARLSRQMGAALEVEDIFRRHYNLEVSSPGLERPLFTSMHFQQFVGRMVRIRLRIPRDGQRHFKGIIDTIKDQQVVLQLENKDLFQLDLNEIEKANLVA